MDKIRNKALLFSRVEGGTITVFPFDVYEDELHNYTKVITKEVFCKMIGKKLKTRVIQFDKIFVKALFFENGFAYDVTPEGFVKRKGFDENDFYRDLYRQKTA